MSTSSEGAALHIIKGESQPGDGELASRGARFTTRIRSHLTTRYGEHSCHLVSLDMDKTALKKPYHVPVVWCRTFGQGKVLYTSLGHNDGVWNSAAYKAHLLGAVSWLSGRAAGAAPPNPEVHQQEPDQAKNAAGGTP